ncbi:hypothetical protein AB0O34_04630 [Sphaerisporangium sp. NPDC088356]|uniref:hypothetical protein n=1 Tax=Sphaerisporangium sp. NPDC088356 TaxID=3154871 RepID=UPI00342E7A0B
MTAGRHRWFAAVLSAGVVLRALAMIGYRPALWFPDSYTYVVTAMRPRPDLVRPAGYSMFLRLLEPFHSFGVVALVQHVLGLATGVLVYAAARRLHAPDRVPSGQVASGGVRSGGVDSGRVGSGRGGSGWTGSGWTGSGFVGALAAAPVLLDAYQVELEHLLVSDTLFMFLVVAAVYVAMGPLTWRTACVTGLLLATATLTRTVGLPLIAVVAGWLLVHHLLAARRLRPAPAEGPDLAEVPPGSASAEGPGLAEVRPGSAASGGVARRVRLVGVLVVVALVPIAGYAAWFSSAHHRFGIVGSNGVFLYARTMAFADCGVLRPPPDLAVLCDPTPPARRPPSQEYVWAAGSPLVALPGITFTARTDRLAGRFALLALRGQPVDYAASVLSELARSFAWGRPVYPDQQIYDHYEFPAAPPPPPDRDPATAGAEFAVRYERGPIGTRITEPFAGWTRAYQDVARLPGTVLLALLLAPPVVAAARRRTTHRTAARLAARTDAGARTDADPSARTGAGAEGSWVLPWVMALSLLVIPAATAEFDYRYVLPAVPLACLAAALMTSRQADQSETALPAKSVNFQ